MVDDVDYMDPLVRAAARQASAARMRARMARAPADVRRAYNAALGLAATTMEDCAGDRFEECSIAILRLLVDGDDDT